MSAPDLSPEALARLEEAARGATPGRLHTWYDDGSLHGTQESWGAEDDDLTISVDCTREADAAYIAAASPDVVLALVQAARERERYRVALDDVDELLGRVDHRDAVPMQNHIRAALAQSEVTE